MQSSNSLNQSRANSTAPQPTTSSFSQPQQGAGAQDWQPASQNNQPQSNNQPSPGLFGRMLGKNGSPSAPPPAQKTATPAPGQTSAAVQAPVQSPGLFGRMLGRTGSSPQPAPTTSSNPAPVIASNQHPNQSEQPLINNGAPPVTAPLGPVPVGPQHPSIQPLQPDAQQPPAQQQAGFFGRMFGRKPAPAPAPVNSLPADINFPKVPLPPLTSLSLYVRITQAWAIYLTLAPVVASIILKESSFFSWVLLGCLGWSGALVIDALVIFYWPKKRIEPCYILDVALTLFFAGVVGASLGGGSSYQAGVVRYFNISLHCWLGCVMLGSYLLGYPWVLQHAKEASPKYVWTSKSFLEVVNSLTTAWTISQFLTSALCVVPLFVGTDQLMDPVDLVLNYVFPIFTLAFMLCVTRWYPNFARVRWLIPRHLSSVKPLPDAEMGFHQPPQNDPRFLPPQPQVGLQPQFPPPQPEFAPQVGLQPQFGLGIDASDRPPISRSLQPQFGLDSEEPRNSRPPFGLAPEMSNSSLDDNFPPPLRSKEKLKAPLVVPQIGKHTSDKRANEGFGLLSEAGSEKKGLLKKPQEQSNKEFGLSGYGLAKETGGGKSSRGGSKFGLDSDLDSDLDGGSSTAAPPQPRKFGLVAEENDRGQDKDKPRSPLISNSRQALPSIRKPASKGGFGLDAE